MKLLPEIFPPSYLPTISRWRRRTLLNFAPRLKCVIKKKNKRKEKERDDDQLYGSSISFFQLFGKGPDVYANFLFLFFLLLYPRFWGVPQKKIPHAHKSPRGGWVVGKRRERERDGEKSSKLTVPPALLKKKNSLTSR